MWFLRDESGEKVSEFFPSQAKLAMHMQMTPQTLQRAIKKGKNVFQFLGQEVRVVQETIPHFAIFDFPPSENPIETFEWISEVAKWLKVPNQTVYAAVKRGDETKVKNKEGTVFWLKKLEVTLSSVPAPRKNLSQEVVPPVPAPRKNLSQEVVPPVPAPRKNLSQEVVPPVPAPRKNLSQEVVPPVPAPRKNLSQEVVPPVPAPRKNLSQEVVPPVPAPRKNLSQEVVPPVPAPRKNLSQEVVPPVPAPRKNLSQEVVPPVPAPRKNLPVPAWLQNFPQLSQNLPQVLQLLQVLQQGPLEQNLLLPLLQQQGQGTSPAVLEKKLFMPPLKHEIPVTPPIPWAVADVLKGGKKHPFSPPPTFAFTLFVSPKTVAKFIKAGLQGKMFLQGSKKKQIIVWNEKLTYVPDLIKEIIVFYIRSKLFADEEASKFFKNIIKEYTKNVNLFFNPKTRVSYRCVGSLKGLKDEFIHNVVN